MFSLIIPGRPCLTPPQQLTETQFAFSFPSSPSFSHIVVFLLPGQALPPESAAAVYMRFPGQADFKLLGAIGNEKPSAIWKVSVPTTTTSAVANGSGGVAMDGSAMATGEVSLGISIEPQAAIQTQLATSRNSSPQMSTRSSAWAGSHASGPHSDNTRASTKVLAQRIIADAFNYLASFSSRTGPGTDSEVVPLRAFRDWWTKFERRVAMDPSFLERVEGGPVVVDVRRKRRDEDSHQQILVPNATGQAFKKCPRHQPHDNHSLREVKSRQFNPVQSIETRIQGQSPSRPLRSDSRRPCSDPLISSRIVYQKPPQRQDRPCGNQLMTSLRQ